MNFSSYIVLSTLIVFGIVAHAYVAHEQFYPAVVYLSTDKMCLAVMYNFAFALFLLFGKVLLRTFIGTLRDLEVEQLVDSGRGFLADTILFLVFYAPTIDNQEVSTVYLIQYICCVIFMKVFHLTTQIRVSHMFEVGVPRFIVNLKLVTLMAILLSCDLIACQYFYNVASRSSTFFTWILFEALTMSTVVVVSICKYSVHMIDLRLDNGWPGKSVCLFYIDLIHDVLSMTLFLVFMLTFFVQNPSRLPIYMMADVIQVARKLAQRLRSFRRYRRISLNMEMRFPDATDEEIEQNEHCVICRESLFEGSKPKKLPCGHIFHIDCLRSWIVMQQVCPTCRAEIHPDGPPAVGAVDAAMRVMAQEPPLAAQRAPEPIPTHQQQAATAASAAPAASPSPGPQQSTVLTAPQAEASVNQSAAGAASSSTSSSGAAISKAPPQTEPTPRAPRVATGPATAMAPGSSLFAATLGSVQADGGSMPSTASVSIPRGGVSLIGMGSAASATHPIGDLMDALKRAEEVAKFLREQTDFWMGQVREIERTHVSGVPAEAGAAAGTATSEAGAAAGTATSAAPTESVMAPQDGSSVVSPSGSVDVRDQMAELRRAQQEMWQRKRSGTATSNASSVGNETH